MSLSSIIKLTIKQFLLKFSAKYFYNIKSKNIFYHDIHSTKKYTEMSTCIDLFQQHYELACSKGYTFVKELTDNHKQIMISFDDGFRGLYDNFSFFKEHQIPVTLFVVTDFIGKDDYLNQQEINEMLATGLLTIGSHTCTHAELTKLTKDRVFKELNDSKQILESMFNVPIKTFCFPIGFHNKSIVEMAKSVGYSSVFSSIPGEGVVNTYVQPRLLVQDLSKKTFSYALEGALNIFKSRLKKMHIEENVI